MPNRKEWQFYHEKFLIMERIDSFETFLSVSPFLIKKVIDSVVGGEVQQCKKLINKSILIQTKENIQVWILRIYSNGLRGIDKSEILLELKNRNCFDFCIHYP